ncbi:AMP-binding protein [Mesobacterium pallidum]|uniref:AMP-binding protein n=1 Tax=Mesobacterium pallidum TaxID=2872037 RepID=UPI001EE389F1|nr:AMP-binding protein [Mesobacterium pallidum]
MARDTTTGLLAELLPETLPAAALTWPGGAASRDDILSALAGLEAALDAAGVQQGHRIGLLLPDHPATLVTLLGLVTRASVLPLNGALTAAELTTQCQAAGVDALLARAGDDAAQALARALDRPLLGLTLSGGLGVDVTADRPLRAPGNRQPGLVLLTSGSTGAPKRVPLSLPQMLASARNIAATLELGPRDRALHALPMFHVGAIVDLFLAPLGAGGAVHVAPDPTPASLIRAMRQDGVTWAQLVPTMLTRLLAEGGELSDAATHLRFLRSVSSDLSPVAHAAAETRLGGLPIIQMYGMTETAGQICSNPLPPGSRKPGSVGPAAGPDVAILDGTGTPLPQGAEGEVCVRGPTVTTGYETTDRAEHFHGPWLRTGDLGRLDADGYLFLSGRLKEMINRGGEKISPLEVERAALALPGVAEAAAYADPHPTLGEQVGLAVVAAPGAVLDEMQMLDALRGSLAEFKRPRRIHVLEALPRLGSGKINKRGLVTALAGDTAAPRTGTAAVVAETWQSVLKAPPPADDEDFFDAGGDSLSAMEFLSNLRDRLGRPIPDNLLFEAPRFGAFVARLDDSAGAAPEEEDPLVRYIREVSVGWPGQRVGPRKLVLGLGTVGTRPPLFFCSQGFVKALRSLVEPDRPYYALRSAWGYEERSPEETERLAAIYAQDMMAIQPEGPLHIGGFCEGGKVMRMAARHIEAAGREIALFVSIDHWFPEPSRYPVLHFGTEARRYSPYSSYMHPEYALKVLHPVGSRVEPVAGRHERAFHDAASMDTMRRVLQQHLGGAPLPQPAAGSAAPLAERSRAYKARIRLSAPWTFRPGAPLTVRARVRNLSSETWQPSAQSGLGLVLRLHNLDGPPRTNALGWGPLLEPVAPGALFETTITIDMPAVGLPLVLRATMTDAGIAQFERAPGKRRLRLVWPRAFSRK